MIVEILVSGVVGGIITAVGGVAIKYMFDKRSQTHTYSISSNDQALLVYKDMVNTIQNNFNQLLKDYAKIDSEFLSTREENAALKVTNAYLVKENDELMKELAELKLIIKKS